MKAARRLASLEAYPFAVLEEKVAALRAEGRDVIDLGVGSPKQPVPEFVRATLKEAVDRRAETGYPTYEGNLQFRRACADYLQRRFGLRLDPDENITACIGSKEMVFHLPMAFLDDGEIALLPTPGYSPYWRGATLCGGRYHLMPLRAENDWLPDFESLPEEVVDRAAYVVVNYPNNPTGACADIDFYRRLAAWARARDILLVSDEAYVDVYFDEPAPSALQTGVDGTVAIFSLSKRSAMANYRIGFAAGDPDAIAAMRKLKTNIDAGPPDFVQDAAAAALGDERHTAALRGSWRRAAAALTDGLRRAGVDARMPEGTFYVWAPTPDGSGVDFALRLLQTCGVVAMPGEWLCAPGDDSGAGRVRFALVESEERVMEAAERISTAGAELA